MEKFKSGYPSYYKDLKMASDIEYGFCLWCEAMFEMGFIKSWKYEPQQYQMLEDFEIDCGVPKNTKKRTETLESKVLLKGAGYTPDFEIEWDSDLYVTMIERFNWSGRKLLTPVDVKFMNTFSLEECRQKEITSLIDVKGSNNHSNASQANSNLRFSYQRKLLFACLNIYCNKLIPDQLYAITFVPTLWRSSPKTGKNLPRYKKYRTQEQFRLSIFPF